MKNEMSIIFAKSLLYGGFLIAIVAGWLYGFLFLVATVITP
jgi:hypothetical protein